MSIRGRAARPCLPFTAPCGALSGQVGVYPSATAEARRGQRQGAVWLFPVLFSKCLYETGRRLTPPVPMGRPMSARPGGGGWTCTSGGGMPSALRALVFFLLRWFVSIAASYGNVYGLPAVRAMTVKPELTIGTDAFNFKHHTFSFLPS